MLSGLKKNTAPEVSEILYALIKAVGPQVQEVFRKFAELCILSGKIPKK